ncbi:MAG: LysM peptidoglycan-binding domain-containing protein, partial [Planctomycetota bacterium]
MVRGQDGTAPTNSTTSSTNVAATTTRTVTAKKGQTLQTIAKIVGIALEILARANQQIRNGTGVLLPGALIIVPPYGTPPFVTPPFDPYPPYPVATTEPTSPTTPVEDEPVLAPTNEQPVPPIKQPPVKQPPIKQAPVTKAPTKNGPTT